MRLLRQQAERRIERIIKEGNEFRLSYRYLQNNAEQRMPFNGKIMVELKGKMTTAEPSNTIKVFYHPLSVVADVQKVAGERYFFMEKPRALFEALQKGGGYHSMEVNLLIHLNTFKACFKCVF